MIEYELVGNDLGEVRFAISPLNELVLSLRTLRDPGRFPLQLPWLRATEPARAALQLDLLRALTNDALWTPDFLTPRPYTPLGRIEDEFAALTGTPGAVVRADLAEIHPAGLPPVLRGPRPLGSTSANLIPGASMATIEREAILRTLEMVQGSTTRAAEILGISVRKVQYRLKEYGAAAEGKPAPPPSSEEETETESAAE